jgi:YD repeat-containing protein
MRTRIWRISGSHPSIRQIRVLFRLTSITVSGQTTQFIYDGGGNLYTKVKPDGSATLYLGGLCEAGLTSVLLKAGGALEAKREQRYACALAKMSHLFRAFSLALRRAFAIAVLLSLLGRDTPVLTDTNIQVSVRVGALQFDFVGWTLNALGLKAAQALSTEQSYLDADQRKQIVLDYFDLLDQSLRLEREIDNIFADPTQTDPATASADLKAQLAGLRTRMDKLQPIAEAVLQEQIAAVLAEEGFAAGGQTMPPVSFHITALPGFLVVSPRDRIELQSYANIEPGLTAEGEAELEEKIETELNVSALVVPLGGLGTYPTMIYETPNLNYTIEVGAHEWVHNYLTLRPLGLNYEGAPELRTMNEVAATLAGQEIGQKVIARYYPERVPPTPVPTVAPTPAPAPTPTPDPNVFDFNLQMRETRVKVDELLAAGKIEEAEAYMETRRLVFWERGYRLRKLNQAYFAFYGAYNVGPGAGGADPVGPAVRQLRDRSSSVKDFLDTISWMTSFEELQETLK